jgi:hypothetical protein
VKVIIDTGVKPPIVYLHAESEAEEWAMREFSMAIDSPQLSFSYRDPECGGETFLEICGE